MATVLIIVAIIVWLITGYVCWRVEYYTTLKYWWCEYGEDARKLELSNGTEGALMLWKRLMPIVVISGLINLPMLISDKPKYGYCFYFRIPK